MSNVLYRGKKLDDCTKAELIRAVETAVADKRRTDMFERNRRSDGSSFFDQPVHGWPRRRIIWSCTAARGPLLTRYYLFDTRWCALYLHHLHVSDEDRALHDHPWAFVTLLLSSGYYEWTSSVQRLGLRRTWRRRFSVLYRPATWAHRLELVRPTWTLVLRFRRQREWGFFTGRGWLNWKDYGKEWCD